MCVVLARWLANPLRKVGFDKPYGKIIRRSMVREFDHSTGTLKPPTGGKIPGGWDVLTGSKKGYAEEGEGRDKGPSLGQSRGLKDLIIQRIVYANTPRNSFLAESEPRSLSRERVLILVFRGFRRFMCYFAICVISILGISNSSGNWLRCSCSRVSSSYSHHMLLKTMAFPMALCV